MVAIIAQTTPSYSTFWWSGCTFVISAFVLGNLAWRKRDKVDGWLRSGRVRRGILTLLFVVVFPVLIAAIVDFVDLSDAAAGKVDGWDPLALSIGAFLFTLTAISQILLWWHTDQWDERVKIAEYEKNLADDTLGFALEIAATFLGVVGKKADRVKALLLSRGSEKVQLPDDVKNALNPQEQIVALVSAVHAMFRGRVSQEHSPRVALFTLEGDYYTPVQCWDGATTNCVTSPSNHLRENFRVDSAAHKCLLVYAAQDMNVQIVSDADAVAGSPAHAFNHFDHDQSNRIKSIAVLPLRRGNEPGPITTILSIDTTQREFFDETRDKPRLSLLAKNLAHRLLFERDIAALLA